MTTRPIIRNAAGSPVEGSAGDPAIDLIPIVPSDTVSLPKPARAIRCAPTGAAGTLRFVTVGGVTRTTSIAQGELLPVAVMAVRATGTTATQLEAYL